MIKLLHNRFTGNEEPAAVLPSSPCLKYILACASLFAGLLLPATNVQAQCTGSLGDPIFKETFGAPSSNARPQLGPALGAGVTNYPYYSPSTFPSQSYGPLKGQYTISNASTCRA